MTLLDLTASNTSFSRVSPGLQLAVDSHSLGQFKTCPRLYYYTVICGYQPRELSVHLLFGLLVHSGRERYYHSRANGAGHETALEETVAYLLEATWNKQLAKPLLFDHQVKTRQSLLRTLIWYLDSFGAEDPLQTVILENGKPAVELSFRFDSGFKTKEGEAWLLCGHLDRLARLNGLTYIDDLKTTLYSLTPGWFSKFTPGNQFSLYCVAAQVVWHEPVQGLIVDGVQVLSNGNRFERGLVPRPQPVLDEWFHSTGRWLHRLEEAAGDGAELESLGLDPIEAWEMNDSSCDKYGGCPFREVCSRSPASREGFLSAGFKKRVWDPLQVRGDI